MRIKTEHGTGSEYILYAPNKNYDASGMHCDMCAVRFYADCFEVSKSGLRHKGWPERKVWLDAMSGNELSDAYVGSEFRPYSYTDVICAKRSIRVFLLPLVIALAVFAFGILTELWWLLLIAVLLVPLCCFGFCVRIKTKNSRSIIIPYCCFRHGDLADIILDEFDKKIK